MKLSEYERLLENLGGNGSKTRLRSNRSNTGKPFEKLVLEALERYEVLGIMRAKKVDPPVTWRDGKLIMLKNPFLDFVGTWTERGGRSLFFEAKSTRDPYLSVNAKGGITPRQCQAIRDWSRAGAVVFLLWQFKRDVVLIPGHVIMAKEMGGENLKFGGMLVPEHGFGWPNFIEVLRRAA